MLVQAMFTCKDKRYKLDFECIKFFKCCKKGQGIKEKQGGLHLEFNMMFIKPICLTTTSAVWNFSCKTKYNQGYFIDISITCFFPTKNMCVGNVLSITSSRHMQYMIEMWGMSKFVSLFFIRLLKMAILGVPHFKVKVKKYIYSQ